MKRFLVELNEGRSAIVNADRCAVEDDTVRFYLEGKLIVEFSAPTVKEMAETEGRQVSDAFKAKAHAHGQS